MEWKAIFSMLILSGRSENVKILLTKSFAFSSRTMEWSEAQEYCRSHFTDLASFENIYDMKNFFRRNNFKAEKGWIGLHKAKDNDGKKEKWTWSDGQNIERFEESLDDDEEFPQSSSELCGALDKEKILDYKDCSDKKLAMCYRSLRHFVIVEEPKTWSEAFEHCKENYTGLASTLSSQELGMTSLYSPSKMLWIGMRFVVRHWLWVSGEALEYEEWPGNERPQCPVHSTCAALDTTEKEWRETDCESAHSFVCYEAFL